MPFEVTLTDTSAATARLDKMIGKLQALPISDELVAWQREDMKRRFPNVEAPNPTYATTSIWPRSRKKKATRGRVVRRAKPLLRGKATRVSGTVGKHPILRPELFQKLCDRMRAMMARELRW